MIDYTVDWVPVPRKDGRPGRRTFPVLWPFSVLRQCGLCGYLGPARRVKYRSECYGWAAFDLYDLGYPAPGPCELCDRCWGRVRTVVRLRELAREFDEHRRAIMRESNRVKNNRRNARPAAGLDRGSEGREDGWGTGPRDQQTGAPGQPVAAG